MAAIADGKWRALGLVGVAELFAMTLWFSGTAVGPELAEPWNLSAAETAWLTNAVQLGFVDGALLSATLTVADVVCPRYLFASFETSGTANPERLAALLSFGTIAVGGVGA